MSHADRETIALELQRVHRRGLKDRGSGRVVMWGVFTQRFGALTASAPSGIETSSGFPGGHHLFSNLRWTPVPEACWYWISSVTPSPPGPLSAPVLKLDSCLLRTDLQGFHSLRILHFPPSNWDTPGNCCMQIRRPHNPELGYILLQESSQVGVLKTTACRLQVSDGGVRQIAEYAQCQRALLIRDVHGC